MRKILSILMFLICSSTIFASNIEQATIKISVINEVPQIIDVSLSPSEAYTDSILNCSVKIKDEFPQDAVVHFRWYKNNILLSQSDNSLRGFSEGDNIKCVAVPEDSAHQFGEPQEAIVVIQKTPMKAQLFMPVISLLGSETSTEKIMSQNPMQLVTGMVVGANTGSQSLVLMLLIFILIIVNINLLARLWPKKERIV
ncbi:hypothetical protein JW930_03500 [Candidatus Woesearchaeota archaeon]|nr:hypothetical protein [Candidatus Woesearchaeota archaeon]